jgi:hypothetical protein
VIFITLGFYFFRRRSESPKTWDTELPPDYGTAATTNRATTHPPAPIQGPYHVRMRGIETTDLNHDRRAATLGLGGAWFPAKLVGKWLKLVRLKYGPARPKCVEVVVEWRLQPLKGNQARECLLARTLAVQFSLQLRQSQPGGQFRCLRCHRPGRT